MQTSYQSLSGASWRKSNTDINALQQRATATQSFRENIQFCADSPYVFHQLMSTAFGRNYDKAAAEDFRQSAINNDFSWLPVVKYASSADLGGALGAFHASSNTIFINETLHGTAAERDVFTEEVGHFLDSQVNTSDSAGDEGAIFCQLLKGEKLSTDALAQLRSENDQGTITINGEVLDVEFRHIEGGGPGGHSLSTSNWSPPAASAPAPKANTTSTEIGGPGGHTLSTSNWSPPTAPAPSANTTSADTRGPGGHTLSTSDGFSPRTQLPDSSESTNHSTPAAPLTFSLSSTESELLQIERDTYRAYVEDRNSGEVQERLADYPFAENVYIPDTVGSSELLQAHVNAQQDLRSHRENLVQTYVNESLDPQPISSTDTDFPAAPSTVRAAELHRLTEILEIDDQVIMDASETMSRGIAASDTDIPQYLFPESYQQNRLATTSEETRHYLTAFNLDDTVQANELLVDIEIRTVGTVVEYYDVFDHPNGGTDGLAHDQDFFDLADGEYDQELVRERLIDTYGVPESEVDAKIAQIEWAARELQENDQLREAVDGAYENDDIGDVDHKASLLDAQTWVMNATVGRTDADSLAIRENIITWHIADEPSMGMGLDVADVVTGESKLGPLTEAEQDLMVNTALDKWIGQPATGDRWSVATDELLFRLAQSDDKALYRRATDIYLDRAIQLVSTPVGEEVTPEARTASAGLTSIALLELGAQEDTQFIADVINDRSTEEIYTLVDVLELHDNEHQFTAVSVASALQVIIQLSKTPATDQTDALTISVFQDLPGDRYSTTGIENVFAEVLTRNWNATNETSDEVSDRIAGVLGTRQGRDLLGYNENMLSGERVTVLTLFAQNEEWDADLMRSHDGNGWTNPTVMTAYAEPIVQDHVDFLGDEPVALDGHSLQNTIGFAIGLPVDSNLQGTPEQIASGTVNAYTENDPIVSNVAESIQYFAGEGNTPQVTVLPVLFSDGNLPPRIVPLFRVTVGAEERYVDAAGSRYEDFATWQEKSELPPGNFTYPTDGHLSVDENGVVELTSRNTPDTDDTKREHVFRVLDTTAQVGGLVAGGVLIVGTGGAATPFVAGVAVASGGWSAYRAADRLQTSHDRGRSINPVSNAQARGDWFEVVAGGLGVVSGGGQALGLANRGARGASLVRGLAGTGELVDVGATANDAHTLISQWDSLSDGERAMLAVSVAFWGAEKIAPPANGPAATLDRAVSVDEDGNVTVNSLADDAPEWLVAIDDGATIPDLIPIENLVDSVRTIDGGLPTLVANATANGRMPELVQSGALTRADLQYLRTTGAIDVDTARAAIDARATRNPDIDEVTLRFADDDMDSFNIAANSALPDTTYEWGNYSWTTDSQGRVSTVEGEIELDTIGRNDSSLQTGIGNEGGEYDVGFHIIADRFGAPINRLNVVPGNGVPIPGDPEKNLNGSAYKIFENQMARLTEAAALDPDLNPPEVRITLEYNESNTTARPDRIVVEWRTDPDASWDLTVFENKFEAPSDNHE